MESEEQRKQDVYNFFKEKMNVDISTFSEEKLDLFVKEMNKILDEQIKEEKIRNIELTNSLKEEYASINQLMQEMYES